ncbi:MAG: SRPBCC family protein, partial [Candidatus Limnocylindria bacterium]
DVGPLAAASRIRVRPKGLPASIWDVIEYDEGRSFTWVSSPMPGLVLSGGHVLATDGDTTTAEFSLEATGPLGKLMNPLLGPTVFSRNTRSATKGLKRHIEA